MSNKPLSEVKCLSGVQKKGICSMYSDTNMNAALIAYYYGVSKSTVYKVLEDFGVARCKHKASDATKVVSLIHKYKLNSKKLQVILEHHFKTNPVVQPIPTSEQNPLF